MSRNAIYIQHERSIDDTTYGRKPVGKNPVGKKPVIIVNVHFVAVLYIYSKFKF